MNLLEKLKQQIIESDWAEMLGDEKKMNKWQQRADEFKNNLRELDEWLLSNWSSLPEGVKRVICRGQNSIEDRIEKYEEWAKADSTKAE